MYRNYLKFCCMGDCISFLSFAYLFKSFTYIIMDSWIFYTSNYNPVLHYLSCSSFGSWKQFQMAPGSLQHASIIIYVCMCTCVCVRCREKGRCGGRWRERERGILFCHNAPGSFCIFLVPVQELAISARILGSFYWRRELETKN